MQPVVVNRSLARLWLPDQSPVGRRVRFDEEQQWATIVGVSADVPLGVGAPAGPRVFVPTSFEAVRSMTLLIRTVGDPTSVVPAVRGLLQEMEPDAPVIRVAEMEERIEEPLA